MWQIFFVVAGLGQLCGFMDVISGAVSAQSVIAVSNFVILVSAFIGEFSTLKIITSNKKNKKN